MTNQCTVFALLAVLLIGTAANAQEAQRRAAEIQADIARLQSDITRLQTELQKAEWDAAREENPNAYIWITLVDSIAQPIAGAKATLTYRIEKEDEPQTLETVSNAKGEVLFPPITPEEAHEESEFILHIEKDNLASFELQTSLALFTRQSERRLPLFETARMEEAVRLTGRFVQESGEPISDVSLLTRRVGSIAAPGGPQYYSPRVRWDNEGRFSILASRNSTTVFLARHADFAPKRFSTATLTVQRTNVPGGVSEIDFGDIVLKSGEFRPSIQVLDKEGKPISDIWVNLQLIHSKEEEDLFTGIQQTRPGVIFSIPHQDFYSIDNGEWGLTDNEGRAAFGPAETGRYFLEFGDEQMRRYNILPKTVELSADAPALTVRESNIIDVAVQFSDKATSPERERQMEMFSWAVVFSNTNRRGLNALVRGTHLGEGKFLFRVPDQLQEVYFLLTATNHASPMNRFQNELSYRAVIEGEIVEPSDYSGRVGFLLEKMYDGQHIEIICYQSPKIILNVVDEEGTPIREFVAGAQYAKREQEMTFTQPNLPDDPHAAVLRTVEGEEGLGHFVHWNRVDTDGWVALGMDIEFAWRNFGEDTAKVNYVGIFPDEELRLYVVGKGYEVFEQTLKLAEGEERELTIVLKK